MKIFAFIILICGFSYASVIEDYLTALKIEVQKENINFVDFDKKRGEKLFLSKHIGKKGKEVSCASCHTKDLTQKGKNIFTGKLIEPLSPKTNTQRFTEIKTVKKWLRRNFKDVYKREGTSQEKGDVLVYILNQGV